METENVNGKVFERWSVDDVAEGLAKKAIVLIDVRMPQEYGFERIDGAMNYPMAFFDPETLPEEGKRRIVLHCGGGLRSERVAKIALEAGMDRIAHLEGGFGAWKEAKRPYMGTDFMTGSPKKVTPE